MSAEEQQYPHQTMRQRIRAQRKAEVGKLYEESLARVEVQKAAAAAAELRKGTGKNMLSHDGVPQPVMSGVRVNHCGQALDGGDTTAINRIVHGDFYMVKGPAIIDVLGEHKHGKHMRFRPPAQPLEPVASEKKVAGTMTTRDKHGHGSGAPNKHHCHHGHRRTHSSSGGRHHQRGHSRDSRPDKHYRQQYDYDYDGTYADELDLERLRDARVLEDYERSMGRLTTSRGGKQQQQKEKEYLRYNGYYDGLPPSSRDVPSSRGGGHQRPPSAKSPPSRGGNRRTNSGGRPGSSNQRGRLYNNNQQQQQQYEHTTPRYLDHTHSSAKKKTELPWPPTTQEDELEAAYLHQAVQRSKAKPHERHVDPYEEALQQVKHDSHGEATLVTSDELKKIRALAAKRPTEYQQQSARTRGYKKEDTHQLFY